MRVFTTVTLCNGNKILSTKIGLADCFGKRLRGLMFYKNLPEIDGLLIYPCNSIHTFWMRFSLDVLFLSRAGEVLLLIENLEPNKVVSGIKKAYAVLELSSGTVAKFQLKPGELLTWEKN